MSLGCYVIATCFYDGKHSEQREKDINLPKRRRTEPVVNHEGSLQGRVYVCRRRFSSGLYYFIRGSNNASSFLSMIPLSLPPFSPVLFSFCFNLSISHLSLSRSSHPLFLSSISRFLFDSLYPPYVSISVLFS